MSDKIKAEHPDLKGAFVCLGNWYNLFHEGSMATLNAFLYGGTVRLCGKMTKVGPVTPGDLKIAKREIKEAKVAADKWERDVFLSFLYDEANEQGDWSVKF